jgi:transcriptional regulator with XRE-family HTH domain
VPTNPRSKPKSRQKAKTAAPERTERVDKHLMEALGAQVKVLRQALSITASEVAQAAGLSVAMLSKIENGQTAPSLATLQSLAAALNVPITALFMKFDQKRDATFVKAGQGLAIDRRGTRAAIVMSCSVTRCMRRSRSNLSSSRWTRRRMPIRCSSTPVTSSSTCCPAR